LKSQEKNISDELVKELVEKAKTASMTARAHLSGFKVGAAIVSEAGNVYTGCNIEFDNYSNTIHAEEAAISALISAGETHPIAIAVATSGNEIQFPCGMCLQSLFEIGGPTLKVIATNNDKYKIKTIRELLPSGFRL